MIVISIDPTKYSVSAEIGQHKFYAEMTDFPQHLAPLILDCVTLYDARDWRGWVQKDRKRINSGEASGQTWEPAQGDYEVIGNHSYVWWELSNWKREALELWAWQQQASTQ